jgi:RNA polymerase-binding transcription factor DksA
MQTRLEKLGETFIREAFDRVEDAPCRSWVATHGFCLECGARIDPKRLQLNRVNLFCMACEQAAERMLLLTAVFGS